MVQYRAAAVVTGAGALTLGETAIDWTPAFVVARAWPLLGETLAPLALLGMVRGGLGVALVTRPRPA